MQLQACNFIKKEALTQVFSCEFYEILKNIFFTEQVRTTASVLWKRFYRVSLANALTNHCAVVLGRLGFIQFPFMAPTFRFHVFFPKIDCFGIKTSLSTRFSHDDKISQWYPLYFNRKKLIHRLHSFERWKVLLDFLKTLGYPNRLFATYKLQTVLFGDSLLTYVHVRYKCTSLYVHTIEEINVLYRCRIVL